MGIVVSTYIYLITNNVWFFQYIYNFLSSFIQCLLKLLPIFNCVVVFRAWDLFRYINMIANILTVSTQEQKFIILIKFSILNFYVAHAFWFISYLRNLCLTQNHKDFSSRRWILLSFSFWSMIILSYFFLIWLKA